MRTRRWRSGARARHGESVRLADSRARSFSEGWQPDKGEGGKQARIPKRWEMIETGSETEFPRQLRSQTKFGNERNWEMIETKRSYATLHSRRGDLPGAP